MAIKEFNVDLDVKGRVLASTVPNSTGSIVTWNTTTNVFGLRTNTQIISDLNLSSNFVPYTGATANVNLGTRSITSTGGFIGNATTATTLATSRTINGTSFNGSDNITTANWGTARTIKIGSTGKSVNGSANYTWTLAEIGAEPTFTKNTAFNKNFGTTAGTVAQGNDSRINNGQTAFGWGDFRDWGLGNTQAKGLNDLGAVDNDINTLPRTVNAFIFPGSEALNVPSAPNDFPIGLRMSFNVNIGATLLFGRSGNDKMWFRTDRNGVGNFNPWREIWHTGNFNPSNYALASSIPTVNNGQLSLSTGAGLSGSATFTANQSGSSSFSVAVASTHKLPTTAEWNALSTQTLSNSTSNLIVSNTVQRAALTGDVTASQNSNATTIANSAVTHAKYQNIPTQRILGRGATGTGNVQELTLGANLSLSTSGVLSSTNTNTTYSAGTGLSLSGTTFGQAITTNGTGTFVTGVTQTTNGFQINLGTPPNTNTTYSNMSLTELNAGTVTTARSISAKTLTDWGDGKYALKAHTHTWAQITGKPTTFTPSAHTHNASDVNAGVLNIARIPDSFVTKDNISSSALTTTVIDFDATGNGASILYAGASSTNRPSVSGQAGGLLMRGNHSTVGEYQLYLARGENDALLYRNQSGVWNRAASRDWVDNQGFSTQTLSSSTSNLIVSNTVQRAALTGDVTASQNSNATTIANNAVTHAKYQNIPTQRILGRGATGTGNVQELTLGSNLSLSTAGVLSATNTNTTYSEITAEESNSLTSSTGRLITGRRLNSWGNSKYLPLTGGTLEDGATPLFLKRDASQVSLGFEVGVTRRFLGINAIGDLIFGNDANINSTGNVVWHKGNLANGTTSQYIRGDGSLATYANTTYSAGTLALLNAGTDTTNRVWGAKPIADYVKQYAGENLGLQGVTERGNWTTNNIEVRLGNISQQQDLILMPSGSSSNPAGNAALISTGDKGFRISALRSPYLGTMSTAIVSRFGMFYPSSGGTGKSASAFTIGDGSDWAFTYMTNTSGTGIGNGNKSMNINLGYTKHHSERMSKNPTLTGFSRVQSLEFPPESGTLATREWMASPGNEPPSSEPGVSLIRAGEIARYLFRNNFTINHSTKIIDAVDTKYTAGTNVSISASNVISATNTNTTYSQASVAQLKAGTNTSNRLINPMHFKEAVEYIIKPKQILVTATVSYGLDNGATFILNGASAAIGTGTLSEIDTGAEYYIYNNTNSEKSIYGGTGVTYKQSSGTTTAVVKIKANGAATIIRIGSTGTFLALGDIIT